jgi:hypothetical protein
MIGPMTDERAFATEPVPMPGRPIGMIRRTTALAAGATLAILLTVAGPISRAYACSCMELQPGQALANADVAFVGVVAGVRDPSGGNPLGSGDPITYSFVVQDVLKQGAAIPAVAQVSSTRDGASCGQTFAVGQRWRLFAYRNGGSLSTGICSGNELLAERVPIPSVEEADPEPPPPGVLVALGAAALVGLVSVWAFTRRGRSPAA